MMRTPSGKYFMKYSSKKTDKHGKYSWKFLATVFTASETEVPADEEAW